LRIEQLTFTRFLAAISIVVYHYAKDIFPFNSDDVSFLFKQANLGVSYFFILSGFVMVIAYWKKDKISISNYLLKRFARIFPVCLLATLILFGLKIAEYYLFPLKSDLNIYDFLLSLSLLQAWIPGKAMSFNTPAWSITVECFFYVIFPFVFNYLYKKYSFKRLFFPILLFWGLSQFIFHYLLNSSFYSMGPSPSHDFLYYNPILHLNQFLIGNLTALFYINWLKGFKLKTDLLILVAFLCIVFSLKYNTYLDFHNGLLMVFFVPLILFISSNNGYFKKINNLWFLVYLGEISYGVYILQKPIFLAFKAGFQVLKIDNPTFIFYTSLLALLIFSALSYKYVEGPLRKKISAWKFDR
jgi:peptidoglycan/LPS O-acetylase OafA/YrhL